MDHSEQHGGTGPRARVHRVRHEIVRRTLTVAQVDRLSPGMLRITLTGDTLSGFTSLGFDDHIKLFFAQPDGATEGRDYTPRHYDSEANALVIDFAVDHAAGPATEWAKAAEVGSTLEIGGPRGSFVIEDDFDWYLFVCDETGLPAVARRLEELRPTATVRVIAEVDSAEEHVVLRSLATVSMRWVHRTSGDTLADALRERPLPQGEGYVWIAGETGVVKTLRQIAVEELHHPAAWTKAAAYWRQGEKAAHEIIERGEGGQ